MSIFGELENLKLEYYDIHRAREKLQKRLHAWDSGEREEETRI